MGDARSALRLRIIPWGDVTHVRPLALVAISRKLDEMRVLVEESWKRGHEVIVVATH